MNYLERARNVMATVYGDVVAEVDTSRTEGVRKPNQDDWWAILTLEERQSLKPRTIQLRCPWCRHIRHTSLCDELRPKRPMSIGKYRGEPIEDLPHDYVLWLAKKRIRLDLETRDEIYDRFGVVIPSENN